MGNLLGPNDDSTAIAGAGIHARYRDLSRKYALQKQELEACRRNYQELHDELQAIKAGPPRTKRDKK